MILKEEVMNAIFHPENTSNRPNQRKVPYSFKNIRKSLYGIVAAVFLVSFVGLIWNNITLREQLMELKDQSQFPEKVSQVNTLKSANPVTNLAQGSVWLYKQGHRQPLVFQI